MLTSSFSRLLIFRPRKGWTKYFIGFLCVLLAYLISRTTTYQERLEFSFLVLYLGIFVATIIGGAKSGFGATFFSLFLIVLTFGYAGNVESNFLLRAAVFGIWSLSTSYIIGLIKNAYQISLSVLNNIHSFVAILSPSGRYVDVNKPALQILGLPKEQLIGRHFLSKKIPVTFSPTQRKQLESAIKAGSNGEASRFDIKFTRDFRIHTFLDFSISPIFDRQKNVVFLVLSATSITTRIEAEAKANRLNKTLQQKVGELQTLFDVLPVGIAISNNPDLDEVQANSALCKLLGIDTAKTITLGDLIEDENASFYFTKDGERLKRKQINMFNSSGTKRQVLEQEVTIVRADGTERTVLINAAPILEVDETVVGWVAVFVDLTERKKVEEALINSELRFKRLVDSNLVGVIVANLSGEVLEANEAMVSLLGYTQEEIQAGAVNWRNITPPEFRAADEKAEQQLRALGECVPYEKAFFRKDGSVLPILVGAVMTEPKTETCVALILDISARKKLEKRKDEFIGLASHELKTPLTSIKVFTQLLDRSLSKSQDTQNLEYLEKMNQQIDRLTSLVEDLLDVSKIESGKLQLNYETFDFMELLKDTIFEVQSISQSHQIKLTGTITQPIYADAYRLGQVISNLLTNAVKYSPAADTVEVRSLETEKEVAFSVTDYGVGIPETEQKRIFDKFFRARGKNRHSFPGLGLGLYVSQQIVLRHGGKIELTSQEGEGSTFTVTVPRGG